MSQIRTWLDEQTGREVRQLTDLPEGATLPYFRMPKHVPDGSMLIHGRHEQGSLLTVDPASGRARPVRTAGPAHYVKLRCADGRLWYHTGGGREIWAIDLPDGSPELFARLPADLPGRVVDVTCDGRTILLQEKVQDLGEYPIPTTKDVAQLWRYFSRPRQGRIWAWHAASGTATRIAEADGMCLDHVDASPADPQVVRYCQDMYDAYGQRVWTVRTDGSQRKMIRPQQRGELVTHEFWWPRDGLIGYTYQDRRGDATLDELPWAEYSPRPTHLGLADAAGNEVYLSEPLNSYHTHLYVSRDGRWVCGEGTDGLSFVFAAPFSRPDRLIEMKPLATIHTPYVPFRGQRVNCDFSADGQWLLFNDTVDGRRQVLACRNE